MGKTCIVKKMAEEAPQDKLPIYHDLEGIRTPLEFVETVFRDVEDYLSGLKRTTERVRLFLTQFSGTEVGGTEAGGTKSGEFCSHCYVGGKFTQPDITSEQMVQFVQGKLREMHIPGFLARRMTKDIPTLKRWAGR
jgi:hypothetical protein